MPTIYDVARTARVSPKTVSRVLNGDAPVRVETREAVRLAMDVLGYVPSSAARSMRSRRSGLIGVITGALSGAPERATPGGLPARLIVQAAQRAFDGTRFTLITADTGGREERVPHLMATFAEHRVEGLIHVADHHQCVEVPDVALSERLVLANGFCLGVPSVVPDDEAGQAGLTAWATARGHRRIAYLTLTPSLRATDLRLRGHRRALAEAGIADDPALVAPDAEGGEGSMRDAAVRLVALPDPPTCILCGNDGMAMRLYGILRSMGVSVPEDVSVAGYDDHRVISEMLYPPLTTAELPYAAMGAAAADILRSMIEGESAPAEPVLVRGGVVPRASVLTRDPTQGRQT